MQTDFESILESTNLGAKCVGALGYLVHLGSSCNGLRDYKVVNVSVRIVMYCVVSAHCGMFLTCPCISFLK